MKKRTLIILVAILVLLYLVGTSVAVVRGEGNLRRGAPDWMESIGSLLERQPKSSDIQFASPNRCRSQFTNRLIRLNPSGSCSYNFKSQSRFRRARAFEVRALRGTVRMTINSGSISHTVNLDGGSKKIPIHNSGGNVSFSCLGGGACEVQIQ